MSCVFSSQQLCFERFRWKFGLFNRQFRFHIYPSWQLAFLMCFYTAHVFFSKALSHVTPHSWMGQVTWCFSGNARSNRCLEDVLRFPALNASQTEGRENAYYLHMREGMTKYSGHGSRLVFSFHEFNGHLFVG